MLNPPYLLFYPDANRDDVPDGDPQVLLTGFGMEDAQAMSNHLTWGPDGWLYGVNGSTTTCRIRGIEFQQGVWRYHPITHEFELFCEGGSNCYGVTFDANGLGINNATNNWGAASDIAAAATDLNAALTQLRTQSQAFRSNLSTVQSRHGFTQPMVNPPQPART